MLRAALVLCCIALASPACNQKSDAPPSGEVAKSEPPSDGGEAGVTNPAGAEQKTPAATPEAAPKGPEPGPPALLDPKDPNEACVLALHVAYTGLTAEGLREDLKRDEAAAQARAAELQKQVAAGGDIRALAAEHSDFERTQVKRGGLGTFTREKWPEKYGALRDPTFALKVHETAGEAVKTDRGFVVLKRCPVEKVHTRHILIRYKGAKNADGVDRSKQDAQKLAADIQKQAAGGGDFAALAKKHGEDGSAEEGGDLGPVGRGMFVPAYEQAAFALEPGGVSEVVETEFGFHVIRREPDSP